LLRQPIMNKPSDDNREENQSQAQSDATPDAVASVREDAPDEFDEIEGEKRKRIHKETGSPIVSKI
jgi:hypothetical protein